jgi:2-amino-4-hydroxy-6-hydroxymethyldihydropteridine diphosphokinase
LAEIVVSDCVATEVVASEVVAYIALGSNLSDPLAHIGQAWTDLAKLPHSRLADCSSLYRSKPVGFTEQPDFINAAAAIVTRLSPRALLSALLRIEARHGRNRTFKNAPRSLDLDLLLYDDLVLHEPGLTLPHPRMTERAFVLAPLLEIAADLTIPGHGRVADCLARLDPRGIQRLPPQPMRAAGRT